MRTHKVTSEGMPLSQSEFLAIIKEAQKGPFKKLGTFDEFKNDVLLISNKKKRILIFALCTQLFLI